jgi:hypothetical protein
MEELADEFEAWCGEQGIEPMCAHELLMIDGIGIHLTQEQRTWLNDFIERWDRQQALVDRIGALRHG